MNRLERIYDEQIRYNDRIRLRSNHPRDISYWSKQYILGLVGELSEVLAEIDWKVHRKLEKNHDTRHNLGRELADITKYVLCLWELHNFTSAEMLGFIEEKNLELNQRYKQEFNKGLAPDVPVLITDIDGTLGDWRKAFVKFVCEKLDIAEPLSDPGTTMAMEIDLGISYKTYRKLKEDFEANGGYLWLEPYPDAVRFIHKIAHVSKWDIVCYTARPGARYGRIWSDTVQWLNKADIGEFIQEVHIGEEERIHKGLQLQELGHQVWMLDDSPSLALRAANAGLPVILRAQPYNVGIEHPNIARVESFDQVFAIWSENKWLIETL